jgi:hypothetical protein
MRALFRYYELDNGEFHVSQLMNVGKFYAVGKFSDSIPHLCK